MKKIFGDIKNSITGNYEYKISDNISSFSYPVELEFTLKDQNKYYSPKDENGIPIKEYKNFGIQYNPTRVAAYTLANWNSYITSNDERKLNEFFKGVKWFTANNSARAEYHFDFGELIAPWISCMAQGEAISVLVRAYHVSNERHYLELAHKYSSPFFVGIESNGVKSYLENGQIFLEEYPFKNPSHVLNGFLYALIGIYELWKIEDKSNNDLNLLFNECIKTLEDNLHRWELEKGWSAYDLKNENGTNRNWCTVSYHSLHVAQLLFVGKVSESSIITDTARKWERSLSNPIIRLKALNKKISYRLKEPAKR